MERMDSWVEKSDVLSVGVRRFR